MVFLRGRSYRDPAHEDWICIFPDGSRGFIPFEADLLTTPLPTGVIDEYCFVVCSVEFSVDSDFNPLVPADLRHAIQLTDPGLGVLWPSLLGAGVSQTVAPSLDINRDPNRTPTGLSPSFRTPSPTRLRTSLPGSPVESLLCTPGFSPPATLPVIPLVLNRPRISLASPSRPLPPPPPPARPADLSWEMSITTFRLPR